MKMTKNDWEGDNQVAERKKKTTVGNILYTQDEIWKRSKEISKEISKDFEGEKVV